MLDRIINLQHQQKKKRKERKHEPIMTVNRVFLLAANVQLLAAKQSSCQDKGQLIITQFPAS